MFARVSAVLKHRLAHRFIVSSNLSTLTKKIPSDPNIIIRANTKLNIQPYDAVACPDSNLLRISIQPLDSIDNSTVIDEFEAAITIKGNDVTINAVGLMMREVAAYNLGVNYNLLVEVPVRANLDITSEEEVQIDRLNSENIKVVCRSSITTNDLHVAKLNLLANFGTINCGGSTVAQQIDLRTYGKKSIYVHNAMGDKLTAVTDDGTISTGSCYSEHSRFITQRGSLYLQNVHKMSEMIALDCGDVNVSGFHGNLQARFNGGKLNFQLTEVHGDSFIEAKNPTSFVVNVSEFVEKHTYLSITAANIMLDSNLNEHTVRRDNTNGLDTLEIGNSDIIPDRLSIQTNSKLELGKLSWMEAIYSKLAAAVEDKNKQDSK